MVEDRAAHAGLGRDPAERRRVEALGVDDRVGDVEDLLAAVPRGHPSSLKGLFSHNLQRVSYLV